MIKAKIYQEVVIDFDDNKAPGLGEGPDRWKTEEEAFAEMTELVKRNPFAVKTEIKRVTN